MAGGFVNTTYKNISDSLVQGYKARLRNPYYKWNSQNATKVTYYNLSNTNTTFDEGSIQIYSESGDSSVRLNKINDCYLYGLDRIQLQLESTDFGLEGNEITGNVITLPNTFQPYPQDYFVIEHVDNRFVFKIIDVTTDTLENGQNFYQMEFKLSYLDESVLDKMVVAEYTMLIDNVGTSFKSILRSNDYNFVDTIDTTLVMLKKYYKSLFYSDRVDTFILNHNGSYFYDPYLIEFIMKNNLMDKSGDYLCVDQKINIPNSFAINYDKTFFRATELIDKTKFINIRSKAYLLDNPLYIMAYRPESYYAIDYFSNLSLAQDIYNIRPELAEHIFNGETYENSGDIYKNIIIEFFEKRELNVEYLNCFDCISYENNIELFYVLPLIIFILEYYLRKVLSKNI